MSRNKSHFSPKALWVCAAMLLGASLFMLEDRHDVVAATKHKHTWCDDPVYYSPTLWACE